jgi:DNA transformation protein and related proteins
LKQSEIEEMFQSLGSVMIKPMFGGKGIYYKGTIIAVEFHGDILLKADAVTAPAFEAAGAIRWAYEGRAGKAVKMPYWSIPAEAFDDPDMMARWVKRAYEAAARSVNLTRSRLAGARAGRR